MIAQPIPYAMSYVIWDKVHEGTLVMTDCWKGYSTAELELSKYQHLTVNHKYNFVNPVTGRTERYHIPKYGLLYSFRCPHTND